MQQAKKMKAIVRENYGGPDELKLQEIKKPIPKENEILVKVHAVSINASDVENMTGSPAYIRAWGMFKPKYKILGSDIAGIVETVGEKVSQFKTGDQVYADALYSWGGFAEYACIPEKVLSLIPEGLSFEVASALPQGAVVAEQGIRYRKQLKPGKKILINGAGGGSGSFAVQMAKMTGAEITAVDSHEKQELMRSLGADYVIDYKKEDFTKNGKKYDLILDLVASHSISDYYRSLTPDGVYGMVGGHLKHIFRTLVLGGLLSLFSKRKMGIIGIKPNEKLDYIAGLIKTEKIKAIIDKTYSLEEVPDAMQYQQNGHAKGKVVVKIS